MMTIPLINALGWKIQVEKWRLSLRYPPLWWFWLALIALSFGLLGFLLAWQLLSNASLKHDKLEAERKLAALEASLDTRLQAPDAPIAKPSRVIHLSAKPGSFKSDFSGAAKQRAVPNRPLAAPKGPPNSSLSSSVQPKLLAKPAKSASHAPSKAIIHKLGLKNMPKELQNYLSRLSLNGFFYVPGDLKGSFILIDKRTVRIGDPLTQLIRGPLTLVSLNAGGMLLGYQKRQYFVERALFFSKP